MKTQYLVFLSLLSPGSAAPIGDYIARALFGRQDPAVSTGTGIPTILPTGTGIPIPSGTGPIPTVTGEVTATPESPALKQVRHLSVKYKIAPTSAPYPGASLSPEDYLARERNEIKHRKRQFGPTGAPSAPSLPTPTGGLPFPTGGFPSIPWPTGGFPGFPTGIPTDFPFPFPSDLPSEIPTPPLAPGQTAALPSFVLPSSFAAPEPTSAGKNSFGSFVKRAAEWMHVGEGKDEKENLMRWV